MAPIKIDGTDITGATIDGTDVQEITVDGQTVFTSLGFPLTFENQDLSIFGGDTGDAFIDNTEPFEGNFSLHVRGSKNSSVATTSVSISRGERYSAWIYGNQYSGFASQNDTQIYWMAQTATSVPDGYFTELDLDDNKLFIRKYPGAILLGSPSVTVNRNNWYEIEFEPKNDGTNFVRVFDNNGGSRGSQLVSTSFSDSEYNSGGIGFGHGGDGGEFEVIADNVVKF